MDFYYTNELQGDSDDKFAEFQRMKEKNPKLKDLLKGYELKPDKIQVPGGFFETVSEEHAKAILSAIV